MEVSTCENPTMPFSGVRISCFMLLMNEVFTSKARSVFWYASVMVALAALSWRDDLTCNNITITSNINVTNVSPIMMYAVSNFLSLITFCSRTFSYSYCFTLSSSDISSLLLSDWRMRLESLRALNFSI